MGTMSVISSRFSKFYMSIGNGTAGLEIETPNDLANSGSNATMFHGSETPLFSISNALNAGGIQSGVLSGHICPDIREVHSRVQEHHIGDVLKTIVYEGISVPKPISAAIPRVKVITSSILCIQDGLERSFRQETVLSTFNDGSRTAQML